MLAFMVKFLIKLKQILVAIYGILCRALCCRRRLKRSNSGMLLPISVNSQYSNTVESKRESLPVTNTSNVSNRNDLNSWQNKMQQTKSRAQLEAEEETDYFKDMIPTFKRQKNVIVNNTDARYDIPVSNRLGVDFKASITATSELGFIDENTYNGSWEDEVIENDVVDLQTTLRDARQAERERRLAEHQRLIKEKELKKMKSQRSNFTATKIS